MKYTCSVCQKQINDSLAYIEHAQKHIIDVIKAKHPEWDEKNGVCHKCVKYFQDQLKGDDR